MYTWIPADGALMYAITEEHRGAVFAPGRSGWQAMEPSGSPAEEWLDVEPVLCRASAELQVPQLAAVLFSC